MQVADACTCSKVGLWQLCTCQPCHVCAVIMMAAAGGYDLKALGESVAETMRGVLGLPSEDKFDPVFLRDEPLDKFRGALKEAQRVHGL